MLKKIILILSIQLLSAIPANANDNAYPYGAVASGHPLATQAGLRVLEQGGNAFDAAVAVSATLNVVEPMMTGLGGYGSTLIYVEKDHAIRFLNASGRFPQNTNSDLMRAPTPGYRDNRKGPKSISTPGNLNAWKLMHTQYGKLPWKYLFKDAIHHAKSGYLVAPYGARIIADSFNEFSYEAKQIYGKNGYPLQAGERLVQNDLGQTFELIAAEGTEPFYHGVLAAQIDKKMKEVGSFLSIEDLNADQAQWWEPLKINYKGYDVYTMGTPGNGFSALYTLGVMGQFPLAKLKHNSQDYLHILIEVLKDSTKVRLTQSGRPEEHDNIVKHVLTKPNFVQVAQKIDLSRASSFELPGAHEGVNTTHFVVVDKWGNVVSSTQTLGTGFGSKVLVDGTGIWMNNSMAFSSFEPKGNPMDVVPGEYKLSSNSPVIIMKDQKPWAALGTPGGHTIPQNVAQIIINLIDFNMSMQSAIDAPKLAFFEEGNVVCTETGIPEPILISLVQRGHTFDNEHISNYIGLSGKIGNAMGIKIEHRGENDLIFDVGVDKRKDGHIKTEQY